MENEEQLREEWREHAVHDDEWESFDIRYFANDIASWWLTRLLQAELRWLTEQIERLQEAYGEDGKPALVIIESLEGCVEQRPALQEVLAPLIERKKEVEKLLGREEGV